MDGCGPIVSDKWRERSKVACLVGDRYRMMEAPQRVSRGFSHSLDDKGRVVMPREVPGPVWSEAA